MPFLQPFVRHFKRIFHSKAPSENLNKMPHIHTINHHANQFATSGQIHRNKRFAESRPSGLAAYARAARKYNFDGPTVVGRKGQVFLKSPGPSGSPTENEVPAQDIQNDLEYVVPVTIGTPGVQLLLDFDTGSSDLWVWSNELNVDTSGHTIYDSKKSSSAKVLKGASWNISYGDGSSASGDVYLDTIKIGSITVPGQAVELAKKLSSEFASGEGSDGLLGLAWPQLNTVTPKIQKTPVENMIDNKIVNKGLFTVALDKGDSNGFYTFGVIDSVKAGVQDSDISYTPVDNSQGFWMFDSGSVTIDGKKITQSGNTAIADTGTTLCLLSDEVVKEIYAKVPGATLDNSQGGYVYPKGSTVPTVEIAVGENLYTINPEDFAYGDGDKGTVFGGIQSRGDNPFDILGDVWLKSVYVVFDQENSQIGVAQRPSQTSETE